MRKRSINRTRNPINKATGTGTTIGYRDIVYNVGPGSDLSGKIIRNAILSDANLDGSLFVDSVMPRCDFSRSKLNGCDFSGAKLRNSNFARAELKNSDFIDADLAYTDFFSADLSGADLRGANLYGSSFLMSDLTGTKITKDQLPQIEYAYFHEAFKLSWSPEDHDIYLREYLRSIEEDLMELRNKVIVTSNEDLGERVANPLKGYGGWGGVPKDPYQYDPAQYAPYHFNPYDNYLEVPGYEYGFGRVTNPGRRLVVEVRYVGGGGHSMGIPRYCVVDAAASANRMMGPGGHYYESPAIATFDNRATAELYIDMVNDGRAPNPGYGHHRGYGRRR